MKILVQLDVNGHRREVGVRAHATLLDVVRDDLNLMGTKRGCDMGTCGCCTVLMDGRPILSCLTLAADCEGKTIETIESLHVDQGLHPLQQAFETAGATQCGYCTPGFIMTAKALLRDQPNATREEIAYGISGNMCRCTGYVKILDALESAAVAMRTEQGSEEASDTPATKTKKKAAKKQTSAPGR